MGTFEVISMAIVGMASVAGVSFAMYSALSPNALNLAAEHGRYSGLGTAEECVDRTPGNRPVEHVGALQGQSA